MRWFDKAGLLATLAGLALLAAYGCRDGGAGDKGLSELTRRHAAELAPFKHEELPSVVGNPMHETHFASKVKCGVCHESNSPLPPDEAQAVCLDCHAEQEVSKDVWKNHCLACHYFTEEVRNNARRPDMLTQVLCLKCHENQDPTGGHLYLRCTDETGEMALCDHCHRPHEKTAPAAIELCVKCHTDLTESRHPRGTDAKCSLCHKPHSPTLQGDKICLSCHGQAKDVLVHRIEAHPKDCLRCHKAHFTTIEIKSACQDCHENRTYIAGRNLPAAHEDCENCHELADFHFRGLSTCAGCHKSQAAILKQEAAPTQHKRCLNCHRQHTWRSSYAGNCDNCHDLSQVLEHNVPYHPKDRCAKCHDPHKITQMPKSGNCDGCHMPGGKVPPFGQGGPAEHRTCENCHNPEGLEKRDFTFVGPEASCRICHSEAKSGLAWEQVKPEHQQCLNCHTPHTFQLADQSVSCEICHGDQVALMPNATHRQCLNCHSGDHGLKFIGVESSCQLCHGDVVAAAPNAMHQDCSNCHALDHTVKFSGTAASCSVCHGTPPELHAGAGHQECLNCHSQHTFAADTSLCGVCHGDKLSGHYNEYDCAACHFFSAEHPAPPEVPDMPELPKP